MEQSLQSGHPGTVANVTLIEAPYAFGALLNTGMNGGGLLHLG